MFQYQSTALKPFPNSKLWSDLNCLQTKGRCKLNLVRAFHLLFCKAVIVWLLTLSHIVHTPSPGDSQVCLHLLHLSCRASDLVPLIRSLVRYIGRLFTHLSYMGSQVLSFLRCESAPLLEAPNPCLLMYLLRPSSEDSLSMGISILPYQAKLSFVLLVVPSARFSQILLLYSLPTPIQTLSPFP